MKKTSAAETDEFDSNAETEILIENTPRRMSDHKIETSRSVSVTRQIKAATDPLTQQLAHLFQLMQELRNEQAHRRHEETASSRSAISSSGSAGRSDT